MEHYNEASPEQPDILPEQLKAALSEKGVTPQQIEDFRRNLQGVGDVQGIHPKMQRMMIELFSICLDSALHSDVPDLGRLNSPKQSDENLEPDNEAEPGFSPRASRKSMLDRLRRLFRL
ncbi:MAG: hypothetical protein WCV62_03930 [Candidatus Peribacteraceae bacterium]|jgi:hypothetical protein